MPSTRHSLGHVKRLEASDWVRRFAEMIPSGGRVLDVACGSGRHTHLLLERGHRVVAVDRDLSRLEHLKGRSGLNAVQADLEVETAFDILNQEFAAVVVTNYLHRPLLPALVRAVAVQGILIYETFASGHERFGRPRNPDFLLRPGELLEAARGELRVLAYEELIVTMPRQAAVQRICARRDRGA